MKQIFCILVLLAGLGCSQVSPKLHPWQSYGNAGSFKIDEIEVDTTNWPTIESERLGRVSPGSINEACELLKEADAIEITREKANEMCPEAQFSFTDNLRPFLIRGVSFSPDSPAYSIVKINEGSGRIYLLQATYTGEFYVPGVRHNPQSAPIVILLKNKPRKVICSANIGGDGIFRGIDSKNTWNE